MFSFSFTFFLPCSSCTPSYCPFWVFLWLLSQMYNCIGNRVVATRKAVSFACAWVLFVAYLSLQQKKGLGVLSFCSSSHPQKAFFPVLDYRGRNTLAARSKVWPVMVMENMGAHWGPLLRQRALPLDWHLSITRALYFAVRNSREVSWQRVALGQSRQMLSWFSEWSVWRD